MFQRTVVVRDLVDPREMDINTAYACMAGTSKPVGTSFTNAENMREAMERFYLVH